MSDKRFVLAGVMGWPVAHTRSPAIHNHWIAKHELKGAYVQLPVQPEKLEAAIRGLSALGFAGCNVTVPHKVNAMKLMDELTPAARHIAAINTIVVRPDGSLLGANNDGNGYIQSLRDANPTWRGDAGTALVLGAGGAARAIVVGLLEQGVPEVRIANRTQERAQALADAFGPRVKVVSWAERNEAMADVKLLVNTTTQGMHGQPALDVLFEDLQVSLNEPQKALPAVRATLVGLTSAGQRAIGRTGSLGADVRVRHIIGLGRCLRLFMGDSA